MKVNVIKNYNDVQLKRLVAAGEDLNVTEDRAEVLINAGVAEAVATPTTEVDTKAAPKKKTPAKKAGK